MHKVLQIGRYFPQQVEPLLPILTERGFLARRVEVVDPGTEGQSSPEADPIRVAFRGEHGLRIDPQFVREIAQIIARERPEIVHLDSSRRVVMHAKLPLAKFRDIPIITTRGAFGGLNAGNPVDWLQYFPTRRQTVACASHALARQLAERRFLGIAPRQDRLAVFYRPLEAQPLIERSAARAALGLGADEIVVGAVCWIRPIKNIPTVATAVAQLRAKMNIRLVVIGDQTETAEMAACRKAGGPAIVLPGRVPMAARYFSAFDMFVSPTRPPGEGFGYSIAEAMLAGQAVISGDCGAGPELIGDTGLVVPAMDVAAWRNAIESLAVDPLRRAALGQAAAARARELFSVRNCGNQLADVYSRIVADAARH